MNIKNSLFLCLFILLISCESNETVETEKIPTATITSYSILENTAAFIKTKTDLEFSDTQSNFLEEHGVYWYKNTGSKGALHFGSLQENQFTADISQGLLKDSIYKTYPYIKFQNKYFYGDTITFKSTFTSMVKIDKVFPLKGFINDTITLEGKNFCTEDFRNTILFGS